MSLLSLHFAETMARLEARLAEGLGYAELFEGVDDDLFGFLAGGDYDDFPAVKAALPGFPPETLVSQIVGGRSLREAMREASQFWRLVKAAYAEHGKRPLRQATAVDYGAGWGRITRLVARDVARVYAVEPNDILQQAFRDNRVPGSLVVSDYSSAQRLAIGDADLLISFSILTHTSDALSRNIARRWAEMLAPGAVAVFTIRPGSFFDAERGEITQRTPAEREAGRAAYDAGKPAYWPYEGSPNFGITVMPMAYLDELFGKDFEIVGPRLLLENPTQLPIVMVRR